VQELAGVPKKKKEKKIQAQIINIRAVPSQFSPVSLYVTLLKLTLFPTAMGPTLGAKICDDGVCSGIAESRESPSTIINCTIKAIRDDLGSLLRETTNRSYARRRRNDTRSENSKRYVKRRRNDTRKENSRLGAKRRRNDTRKESSKRCAKRRRNDTRNED